MIWQWLCLGKSAGDKGKRFLAGLPFWLPAIIGNIHRMNIHFLLEGEREKMVLSSPLDLSLLTYTPSIWSQDFSLFHTVWVRWSLLTTHAQPPCPTSLKHLTGAWGLKARFKFRNQSSQPKASPLFPTLGTVTHREELPHAVNSSVSSLTPTNSCLVITPCT